MCRLYGHKGGIGDMSDKYYIYLMSDMSVVTLSSARLIRHIPYV
jgi:hypothetical protein